MELTELPDSSCGRPALGEAEQGDSPVPSQTFQPARGGESWGTGASQRRSGSLSSARCGFRLPSVGRLAVTAAGRSSRTAARGRGRGSSRGAARGGGPGGGARRRGRARRFKGARGGREATWRWQAQARTSRLDARRAGPRQLRHQHARLANRLLAGAGRVAPAR